MPPATRAAVTRRRAYEHVPADLALEFKRKHCTPEPLLRVRVYREASTAGREFITRLIVVCRKARCLGATSSWRNLVEVLIYSAPRLLVSRRGASLIRIDCRFGVPVNPTVVGSSPTHHDVMVAQGLRASGKLWPQLHRSLAIPVNSIRLPVRSTWSPASSNLARLWFRQSRELCPNSRRALLKLDRLPVRSTWDPREWVQVPPVSSDAVA